MASKVIFPSKTVSQRVLIKELEFIELLGYCTWPHPPWAITASKELFLSFPATTGMFKKVVAAGLRALLNEGHFLSSHVHRLPVGEGGGDFLFSFIIILCEYFRKACFPVFL